MMVAVDMAPPAHMVISAVARVAAFEFVQGGGEQPGAAGCRPGGRWRSRRR